MRVNYSTGATLEDIVGYCRAVQFGNTIEISGTVASDGSQVIAQGDLYGQTRYIIEKIEGVLKQAGFDLKDVVRTRIYVTDISKWEAVGKAHGEFFKDIKPVTSMVEVSALIAPEYLVEIEATAVKV